MKLPLSQRVPGAQLAVLGLGILSALALLGASLVDFGDPRATARAQAQQLVRARIAEVRLAWDAARSSEAAPPGAAGLLRLETGLAWDITPVEPASGAERSAPGPLTRAYFELGHAALQRGDAATALESLLGGLSDAGAETLGYREALFGALRAAGALEQAGRVEELRGALYELPDHASHGTSLQLLAALVPPVDVEGAYERLMSQGALLPPPSDGAAFMDGRFQLEQDPWWGAFRLQLEQADTASGRDWDAAFQRSKRMSIALQTELLEAGAAPSDRWTIFRVRGGWLAARAAESALEVASVQIEAFTQQLLGAIDHGPLQIKVAPSESSLSGATPLPGSPFSVSVKHSRPLGAALAELRRIRILRAALIGLGILVLLASALSARAMARARQLAALRSTFVASVSHDLRTPTQAILLLAQTLEQDLVEAPERQARYHTQIRKEAQRLRRLVEDLLDGARIDRGDGARIERRSVESAGFFQELQGAMEERAESAGAQLRMEVAAIPDLLYVDPDGLYRAVWNLFENALRYGRHGDAPADVRVTVKAVGSNSTSSLRIVVADRGPGIAPQDAKSIFRPFQRLADRGPKSEIQSDTGTGLGLAIVHAICRAHGGSVELQAQEGGARFVLALPIEAPTREAL